MIMCQWSKRYAWILTLSAVFKWLLNDWWNRRKVSKIVFNFHDNKMRLLTDKNWKLALYPHDWFQNPKMKCFAAGRPHFPNGPVLGHRKQRSQTGFDPPPPPWWRVAVTLSQTPTTPLEKCLIEHAGGSWLSSGSAAHACVEYVCSLQPKCSAHKSKLLTLVPKVI